MPFLNKLFLISTLVERFRPGYPRFAALLSTHFAFHNFRRFTRVRMRLLLRKQTEIAGLEASLDELDSRETRSLFLGSHSLDNNPERLQVLAQLKASLAEYDMMLEQSSKALAYPASTERDINSLSNWVEGTSCLARQDSSYLDHKDDLMNLTGPVDNAITRTESVVEDSMFGLRYYLLRVRANPRQPRSYFHVTTNMHLKYTPLSKMKKTQNFTGDEHILLLGPKWRRFCRAITTWLATMVLIIPVVLLDNIPSSTGRLITIVVSSGFFLSVLSLLTEASTVDIFIAGASYTAVLAVFTSNNISTTMIKAD
ncbi:hypothetical protein HYFRA_00010234 [Hymenoscyphus fraxineus]|uniref:DUF6594 domain-containing protein n=1 Tax=Hymenoscyphus fraxineus TaxID=746836 RepID=A0A9N9KU27_9HELO|nr:hypothetical protein HYFRA_00010234 [Hymenoscyphus fraxineus]